MYSNWRKTRTGSNWITAARVHVAADVVYSARLRTTGGGVQERLRSEMSESHDDARLIARDFEKNERFRFLRNPKHTRHGHFFSRNVVSYGTRRNVGKNNGRLVSIGPRRRACCFLTRPRDSAKRYPVSGTAADGSRLTLGIPFGKFRTDRDDVSVRGPFDPERSEQVIVIQRCVCVFTSRDHGPKPQNVSVTPSYCSDTFRKTGRRVTPFLFCFEPRARGQRTIAF